METFPPSIQVPAQPQQPWAPEQAGVGKGWSCHNDGFLLHPPPRRITRFLFSRCANVDIITAGSFAAMFGRQGWDCMMDEAPVRRGVFESWFIRNSFLGTVISQKPSEMGI